MHPRDSSERLEATEVADDQELILVDDENRVVGYETRAACHAGDGILHRAFSVFLFDRAGRVLLQRRSHAKQLWPLHWSNSVCSHPRRGEEEGEVVERRIREELGVDAEVHHLYRFCYHAQFEDVGSEREHCGVYIGRLSDERIRPDEREVADWRWASAETLDREISNGAHAFTPWMRMEWARLRGDLRDRLEVYLVGSGEATGSSVRRDAPPSNRE